MLFERSFAFSPGELATTPTAKMSTPERLGKWDTCWFGRLGGILGDGWRERVMWSGIGIRYVVNLI